jgi:hypothetical protein
MSSLRELINEARTQYEHQLFKALDEYREEITERHAGYLRDIHTALLDRGITLNYASLSVLISQYRARNGIPRRNRKAERSLRKRQPALPTELPPAEPAAEPPAETAE